MATIVIHSRTQEKISGTYSFEWSLHKGWRDGRGELHIESRLLSREKAEAFINRKGLVESHSTRDGEIYDTPDGAFKQLFPNGVRGFENGIIEIIDKI